MIKLSKLLLPALLFFTLAYAETIDSGTWTKKSYKIKGSWSIETLEDGSRELRLSEDFSTRKAPDLKLVLHPEALKDITNKNALEKATVLQPLKSNKGEQVYVLPENTDLKDYKSLLIHCEQYSKLWGGAPLTP